MIYAVNATTLGLSHYDTDAPALAVLDDELFVLQSDKLLKRSGTSDDGAEIDCFVTTGRMHLGDVSSEKQVDRVWLTLATLDTVEVTMYKVYWDGEETIGPYEAVPVDTALPHNRVVRGLLGEAGQWWQVKVANKDGGAFDLRSLVLGVEQTHVLM
jgi:hypothetical protein